ncbi:TetR/AcrR family transcriptional regulator [Actinomadura parmotrematis]|uniref:TetR/AcrR family transcriptional regulator n=1 Tax=Actinomadura parmotrematis TaxID=2864039 RepID=A0ABS7FKU6_9ACTN|nr:TetR/AcrR family transcriptional regulator [Actinomadura parmotrematis]MBW8480979.1 TetR/AcrR family transcriptional regulator [Actinomadura parmotrematis]
MNARERILDAAAEIMRGQGAARATTKEIARAAGYSEALLYKHFRDKNELLLKVLKERMPPMGAALVPGEGTVRANLVATARDGLRFYRESFPMMASMASQPALMAATRDGMRSYGAGPHEPVRRLAAYLEAERDLGRVAAGADPAAAAALLLGACFQQGFLAYVAEDPPASEEAAAALVAPLLPALLPPGATRGPHDDPPPGGDSR